jgi:hypothetical protein
MRRHHVLNIRRGGAILFRGVQGEQSKPIFITRLIIDDIMKVGQWKQNQQLLRLKEHQNVFSQKFKF